jgi:hypothetical protein
MGAFILAMLAAGPPCSTAEMVRADATILAVQSRLRESLDPPSKTRALRLVLATALDRKRAALALCDDSAPTSPFEASEADPFEAGSDDDLAYSVTLDLVGLSQWATP